MHEPVPTLTMWTVGEARALHQALEEAADMNRLSMRNTRTVAISRCGTWLARSPGVIGSNEHAACMHVVVLKTWKNVSNKADARRPRERKNERGGVWQEQRNGERAAHQEGREKHVLDARQSSRSSGRWCAGHASGKMHLLVIYSLADATCHAPRRREQVGWNRHGRVLQRTSAPSGAMRTSSRNSLGVAFSTK